MAKTKSRVVKVQREAGWAADQAFADLSRQVADAVQATDWSKLSAGSSVLTPVDAYKASLGPLRATMLDRSQRKAMTAVLARLDANRQHNLATAMAASASLEAIRESKQDVPRLARQFTEIARGVAAVEGLPTRVLLEQKDIGKIAQQFAAGKAWRKFEKVWVDWSRVRFSPGLRGALDAAAASVVQLRAYQDGIDEGTPRFLARHGWPLPLALDMRMVRRVVGWADQPKRAVTRAMMESFKPRTRAFRASREALLRTEAFAERRVPIRQAIRAMQRGDHYAAICTMLPLVEGVLADVVFDSEEAPGRGLPRKAVDRLKQQEENFAVRSIEILLVSAATGSALFDGFERSDYGRPGETRVMNRHAILHGAARKYGTAENAMKLFLLLVTLAETLAIYQRVRDDARRRAAEPQAA